MSEIIEYPEIVFGLCSAIGTDNRAIADMLSRSIQAYGYRCEVLKVTGLMKKISLTALDTEETPVETRYNSYIDYANRLREEFGDNSVLAAMCCAAIRNLRRKISGKPDGPLESVAYVFDQFKRPEEIDLLRETYGGLFILVSIYSGKDERCARLTQKIASDHSVARNDDASENLAKALIARDENEEGEKHGQRVRDTFPAADIFVNGDDPNNAEIVIARFVKALFGSNSISPTKDEQGMYMAKSAAHRSLDLARQVGAAIFSPAGEIVTMGCNEVPKPDGGTYWACETPDARDYTLGRDENERIKRAFLADMVRRLIESQLISSQLSPEALIAKVIQEATKKGGLFRDAQIMDILEFGRVVHAEMSALIDAARLGRSVSGTLLYCTTFPCHMCAKHILAAGVKKVVFIEPYAKSFAEQLHQQIEVSAGDCSPNLIQFSPFIGIAPVRYAELFSRTKRKDENGNFQEWIDGEPRPLARYRVSSHVVKEAAIVEKFKRAVRKLTQDEILQAPAPRSAKQRSG